ncbi:MAG: SIMPL domain-containing protein [bacterium]
MERIKDFQLLLFGFILGLALIICVIIGVNNLSRNGIEVTGAANKTVTSDYATWHSEITVKASSLKNGYNELSDYSKKFTDYLTAQGFSKDEIMMQKIAQNPVYIKNSNGYDTNKIDYYNFIQPIDVQSKDINKITETSLSSQKLLTEGINFNSYNPQYFYTPLDTIKVELLKDASNNAKQRAQAMIKSTGNNVGHITSSKMGVFQITPINSTDVSDYGINDTSSIKKKVTAVVQVKFAIE